VGRGSGFVDENGFESLIDRIKIIHDDNFGTD
jgi:hypothetical protein